MRPVVFSILAAALGFLCPGMARSAGPVPAPGAAKKVVVIPIREQIANPELYILRRGLKEAIEQKVDTIVLDMETPGGALDVTFEMLKALEKFPGKTVTYVNREAISAGALISAGTDEIYFAPGGVIGAAAPVLMTGGELDETMRGKIVSYLKARVRSISEGKGYRGMVISAMIDMDFEFKIGDQVIKEKGELLSLTAQEAVKEYGEPPQPLLGAGIAEDLDALLDRIHGAGNYSVQRLEVTWSERLAQYITSITPLLLGLGMVLLFIEFKTPGFGIFGISGLILLAVVFFGQYVAGLSGHEPVLFFALGAVLVALELIFFPGLMLLALTGGVLMLGSLVWSGPAHPLQPASRPQKLAAGKNHRTRPPLRLGAPFDRRRAHDPRREIPQDRQRRLRVAHRAARHERAKAGQRQIGRHATPCSLGAGRLRSYARRRGFHTRASTRPPRRTGRATGRPALPTPKSKIALSGRV